MEPLYIILLAIVLFLVLLAIFTAVTWVILSMFRRPENAKAVRKLRGR